MGLRKREEFEKEYLDKRFDKLPPEMKTYVKFLLRQYEVEVREATKECIKKIRRVEFTMAQQDRFNIIVGESFNAVMR